jgi:thioredoxin 1
MIAEAAAGNIITYIVASTLVGFVIYNFLKAKKRMNKPSSENVKILSDENFNATINSGVALVDFWAVWCGPCKVQGPIVDEVADEIGDKANICKLDIDQHQKTAKKLGIQSIPTILLFKDGKIVQKFVGVKPKGVLLKAVHAHL